MKYLTVPSRRIAVYLLVTAGLAAWLSGCTSMGGQLQPPPQTSAETRPYVIGIGDALTIHVWRNPELTQSVVVRPDGFVSMPLMGDLMANGQRPEQLADVITRALGQVIRNPEVTVIVNSPGNAEYQQRVRIVGQVSQPTTMRYQEGMTVADLVLAAGGLTDFAAGDRAELHRLVDGEYQSFPLRLEAVLKDGDIQTNYRLRPADYISVPEKQLWRGEL